MPTESTFMGYNTARLLGPTDRPSLGGIQQLQNSSPIYQTSVMTKEQAWSIGKKKKNPIADEPNWDTGGRKSPSWMPSPTTLMYLAGAAVVLVLVAGGGFKAGKR